MIKYIITGVDRTGKRFKPIITYNPDNYNIWKGTVWRLNEDGTKTKVREIYN